jgi:hypothetical protein
LGEAGEEALEISTMVWDLQVNQLVEEKVINHIDGSAIEAI